MSFFIPIIYFILANGLIVILSNKNFEKCLPITIMLSTFTLYASQLLFKTFKIGFLINILLPVAFLLIFLKKYRIKEIADFKTKFFSNGFFLFIIIYICIYFFDLHRVFTKWDEFSHWGVMVKEMYRLDRFYTIKASTLMAHKDYPPIIQLFELFYSKLSGGYKEAYLEMAVHLLNLSLFIPFISKIKPNNKKKWLLKTIIIITSIFLIYLLFDRHNIINTIYVDYTMSIATAYLLATIIIEKDLFDNFTIINLSIGLCFLLLIKQMSLPLYLMVIFLFTISVIIKRKSSLVLKTNIKDILKVILLIIIIPIFIMKTWNNYVDQLKIEKQFNLKDIKISELKDISNGKSSKKYQQKSLNNYLKAIRKENMTTSYISTSYLNWAIITLILLYLLWYFNKKEFLKHQMSSIIVTITIGYIGYFFVMLLMYVFSFDSIEGPNLASFDRYMPTYILICLSLLFMLFISIYSNKKGLLKKLVVILIILITIQSPSSIRKCYPRIMKAKDNGFKILADKIKTKTKNGSKIYIIAEDSVGDYQYYIKYYLDDKTTNLRYFNFPTENIDNYEEYYNKNIKEYMLKYDYLYLAKLNEEFKEKYQFLFKEDKIEEGNLYKIKSPSMELIKQ